MIKNIFVTSTCVFASFYTVCQHSNNFKSNILFRVGRAAFTFSSMTIDYKIFYMYSNENDSNYSELLSQVHLKAAEKLLALSIVNGGCFIKIGQHLGSLTYLLPEEYVNTLKVLHDSVPNESFENVYQIIKEELGVEPSEIFSEISPIPIGTASLAQVHYGKLKSTNEKVAIKVQHREVRDNAAIDMMCMDALFSLSLKIFPQMNMQWLADETRKNLPRELNFLMEGKNADNIRNRLTKKLPFLKIPKVFWNYSTEKLLVMEYCHGGKINDLSYIKSNGLSPKEVSRNLCKLYAEMIFGQGYFHSDPHPGNILVRSASVINHNWLKKALSKLWTLLSIRSEIVLLDHGLYQVLTDDFLNHYCRLWLYIIDKNEKGIQKEAISLGIKGNMHRLLACMVSGRSWSALASGISDTEFSLNESKQMRQSANVFLSEMIDILNSLPRQMLLILKTNDLLRGVEHSLMGIPYNKESLGLITMAHYCLLRVNNQEMMNLYSEGIPIISWIKSWKLRIKLFWHLFRLNMYSLFI